MTSARSANGTGLPTDKRRARKLKTVTFTLDDLTAGRVSREAFEAEIDRLIGILDTSDPDPDLEENGDLEPSIGTYERGFEDVELDTADDEPSLGSFDRMVNQENWSRTTEAAAFAGVDVELDADCEYSSGESRPGADDPVFPRGYRNRDADVAAAQQASQRLGEIVARVSGLGSEHDTRQQTGSICNVVPLGPAVRR